MKLLPRCVSATISYRILYKVQILSLYCETERHSSTASKPTHKAKTPDGCEECLQMGSDWVHLRLCLSCGHVGCCDSSPNKHATKHFKATQHPIIRSFEPGENWEWCYLDNAMIEWFWYANKGIVEKKSA